MGRRFTMTTRHIQIPDGTVAEFCRRWEIREFSLFGSVLRDDFRPESDIDVVVSFQRDAAWSLLDLATMQEELSGILGRPVDLIEAEALRNPYRRAAILGSRQVVYAAECAGARIRRDQTGADLARGDDSHPGTCPAVEAPAAPIVRQSVLIGRWRLACDYGFGEGSDPPLPLHGFGEDWCAWPPFAGVISSVSVRP